MRRQTEFKKPPKTLFMLSLTHFRKVYLHNEDLGVKLIL